MGTAERKQRERELRRKQILKAAEKIITRKGMQNLTMDEIAESCELSKGTLYLYFKNKEELIISILIMTLDTFIRIMEGNLKKQSTFQERIRCLGESYLEFYKKYPAQFKIMNHNPEQHPEMQHTALELEKELMGRNAKLWSIVENVIREGMDLGLIRKDINPLEIGICLWASSNGMIQVMEHVHSDMKRNERSTGSTQEVDEYSMRFLEMDLEKMLRQLWEAVNSSIFIHPLNDRENVQ